MDYEFKRKVFFVVIGSLILSLTLIFFLHKTKKKELIISPSSYQEMHKEADRIEWIKENPSGLCERTTKVLSKNLKLNVDTNEKAVVLFANTINDDSCNVNKSDIGFTIDCDKIHFSLYQDKQSCEEK
jgi:hypothetical protein